MSPATMETHKRKKEDQNDPAIKLKKTVEGQRNSHHEFRLYGHVPEYVQFSLTKSAEHR